MQIADFSCANSIEKLYIPMRMQNAVRAPESTAAGIVDTPDHPLPAQKRPCAKPATARLAAARMPASTYPAQHIAVKLKQTCDHSAVADASIVMLSRRVFVRLGWCGR